tara:strand:+ start:545 stop:748 length:204 start_codon:yes stop_codon:yes gene_type:complete
MGLILERLSNPLVILSAHNIMETEIERMKRKAILFCFKNICKVKYNILGNQEESKLNILNIFKGKTS